MPAMEVHQKRDGNEETQRTEQQRATDSGKEGCPGQWAGVMHNVRSQAEQGGADGRDAQPSPLS